MKIYRIIIALAAMLFATTAAAQSPTYNYAIWGVNDQNQVFRWNFSQNEFVRMTGIALKQVAVGDEAVLGIDPDDSIYSWDGVVWQQLPGKLSQISIGADHEIWGLNSVQDLFRWNGSSWDVLNRSSDVIPLSDGDTKRGKGISYVSLGVDGTKWGILDIYGGPADQDLPRLGALVTPIARWLDSQQPVTPLPLLPNGHSPTRIWSVNENRGWAIDDTGLLFQWTTAGWQQFDGNYIDVAQAADGELWLLTSDGTVLFSRSSAIPTQQISNVRLKQIAVGPAGSMDNGLTLEQRQKMLDAHNIERRLYPNVAPMQWSLELGQWAQEWAQENASADVMNHRQDQRGNPFRPGEGLGENIYAYYSTPPKTGIDAVESWVAEKQWYHYDQDDGRMDQPPGCTEGKDCGHFTAVIWKNTQYVGCGKARAAAANNTLYFVCNYYPPGNQTGQRPY